ncbi:MAG: nuclear transport factor 2 family protein [Steroidobacteraceae bacterium]
MTPSIPALRGLAAAFATVAMLVAACGPATAVEPTQADFEALKARVPEVQDRQEIAQLIVDYGHLLDTQDLLGYSNLFARQGEWIGGFGRAKGPKAILAMMNKYIGAAPFDARNVKGFHLLTNIVIHLHGDHATGWRRPWAGTTTMSSSAKMVIGSSCGAW